MKGVGNQQDYGLRIYDGRLGRFLSVDPLSSEFAWNSTYSFAENDVVRSVDLDGAEKSARFLNKTSNGTTIVSELSWSSVFPGEEHGPKGTGTYDVYYNQKTKQFDLGAGIYRPSYEDENKVRSWLQEGDARYSGENGLKNAAHDYPLAAKFVGVGIMIAGAASLQPEVVAGGIAVYETADNVENGVTLIEAGVDLKNGDFKQAAGKVASVAVDVGSGALVKPIAQNEKNIEAIGTVGVDVINTVISNQVQSTIQPAKKSSTSAPVQAPQSVSTPSKPML